MRKTVPFELTDGDGNRVQFEITQMSATQQQSWLIRAALALGQGCGALDFDAQGGIDGLMREISRRGLGVLAGLSYDKVQPLLNDLLACCAHVAGKARQTCTPDTVDGFITDAGMLTRLEIEAFKVSFDFFLRNLKQEGQESPSASQAPQIKIPRKG